MKKGALLLVAVFSFNYSFSQTNTFPATGNVGIGTTNSQHRLAVLMDPLTNGTGVAVQAVNSSGVGSQPGYAFLNSAGNRRMYSYLDINSDTYNIGNASSLNLFTINQLGNVGVGTATPVFKLHVNGGPVYVSRSPDNDYLLFDHSSVNTWRTRITTDNTSSYIIGNDLGGLFNTKVLVLAQNGNVGIGTSDTKGYKLAVNGKIRTQEIKVEAVNWPDYVFAKDYKLQSLKETEQHIKDKGHLPGIPSAEEVKENGVDLGEMNKKLLQKIEELTLYLIEIKKENENQNKRLDAQQKELNQFKSRF